MNAKDSIREAALGAGFQRVGFGPAAPPPSAPKLLEWIDKGNAAGLDYMKRSPARRADPRSVFPPARTVVAAAMSYALPPGEERCNERHDGLPAAEAPVSDPSPSDLPPFPGPPPPPLSVARYARYGDYHDVVHAGLKAVVEAVVAEGGRARAFVDTGPLLERGLAAGAGLGWVGKNTCLLSPRLGSWFFIGIVLCDLALEPDPVQPPECGRCTLCLEACPTGALCSPYEVDARRCLSYHSVENRGVVPVEIRERWGATLLGCDRCQEACPHNAVPAAGQPPTLGPALAVPSLRDMLVLDEEGFRRRFRGTSFERSGRAALVRNATLAAACTGRHDVVGLLRIILGDPDAGLRAHAAWSLERLGGTAVLPGPAGGCAGV